MKTEKLLEKIEELIKESDSSGMKNDESTVNQNSSNNVFARITLMITSFFLDVLRSPFKILASYLKNELIDAVKKDAILYALMGFLMGVLFIFFSVLWLTISIFIGVYYFNIGESILNSILYSLGYQSLFFVLISLIAFIAMKNINSIKVLRKLSNKN